MMKESTYADKYILLRPWMTALLTPLKSDLKREHLKKYPAFVKTHFSTKDANRIGLAEMTEVYGRVLGETDSEPLGELVTNLWLLRHGDIYRFFETELSKITTDFTALELIPEDKAKVLLDGAISEFGAIDTWLFAVLNSVVFSEATYKKLEKLAQEESAKASLATEEESSEDDIETLRKNHQREVTRLQEKYEKKFLGLQQKYLHDVDVLNKRIARLTQKTAEKA